MKGILPRLLVFVLLVAVPLHSGLLQGQPRPTRYIIGFDRSASRTPQQLRDMRIFMAQLSQRFEFGDAVDMVVMFRAGSDDVIELRDSILLPRDIGRPIRRELALRSAMREALSQNAGRFTDSSGIRARTTDILGFLRRSGGYARSDGHRHTVIVVLSDMLHSVPGLDFETGRVPDSTWIEKQRRGGLLPDLTGACLVAVGALEGTPLASRVREFWFRYARATGAFLQPGSYQRYLEPSAIRCQP